MGVSRDCGDAPQQPLPPPPDRFGWDAGLGGEGLGSLEGEHQEHGPRAPVDPPTPTASSPCVVVFKAIYSSPPRPNGNPSVPHNPGVGSPWTSSPPPPLPFFSIPRRPAAAEGEGGGLDVAEGHAPRRGAGGPAAGPHPREKGPPPAKGTICGRGGKGGIGSGGGSGSGESQVVGRPNPTLAPKALKGTKGGGDGSEDCRCNPRTGGQRCTPSVVDGGE